MKLVIALGYCGVAFSIAIAMMAVIGVWERRRSACDQRSGDLLQLTRWTRRVVTYPLAFLVTDLTNRAHGPGRARTVAYVGFPFGIGLSDIPLWEGVRVTGARWRLRASRLHLRAGRAHRGACSGGLYLRAALVATSAFPPAPRLSASHQPAGAAWRTVAYVGFPFGIGLSIIPLWEGVLVALLRASPLAQDIALFHRLRRGIWWRAPLQRFFSAFALTGLPWVTWALGDFAIKVGMAALLLIPFRLLMPWIVPSLYGDSHASTRHADL